MLSIGSTLPGHWEPLQGWSVSHLVGECQEEDEVGSLDPLAIEIVPAEAFVGPEGVLDCLHDPVVVTRLACALGRTKKVFDDEKKIRVWVFQPLECLNIQGKQIKYLKKFS